MKFTFTPIKVLGYKALEDAAQIRIVRKHWASYIEVQHVEYKFKARGFEQYIIFYNKINNVQIHNLCLHGSKILPKSSNSTFS